MIDGIIEILKEDAAVQSEVGMDSNAKVKVYPVRYPQKEGKNAEVPDKYLVVYKTPGQPVQGKACTVESMQANFNVHCCADEYSKADALFWAVTDALNNKNATTDAGFRFDSIYFTGDYDTFDENARRFVRVVSFACHAKRI